MGDASPAMPRIALRNCARNRRVAATWGDTHFALSFAAALQRRGPIVAQHYRNEWALPEAHEFDVVVHLRGTVAYEPRPGPINVLWVISHADAVTPEEVDGYDLAFVASSTWAERLRPLTSTPVHVLHQATDAWRFQPPRRDLRRGGADVVVVENARWPTRRAPRWLMESGIPFELYGANWDEFPEHHHVVDDFVPNDELSDLYATAAIVVADQWDAMALDGFVANRLFDVAAAGGFCLSDAGPGVTELFGDRLVTYSSRAELAAQVQRFLADPAERTRLAGRAMRLVRSEHTFDHRATTMLDLLDLGLT